MIHSLLPSGQDPDQILGQVPGVEDHHAKRHFAPDGLFYGVNGQGNFGPKRRLPRATLGILEQPRVHLLLETIPRLFLSRDGELWKMPGATEASRCVSSSYRR
jgi:hypothetical protein